MPLVRERFWNVIKDKIEVADKKHFYPQIDMAMFKQVWGSTALGFGGFGGQAMTDAYTVVLMEKQTGWCGVFFGERLAYYLQNPVELFYTDIRYQQMNSVAEARDYKGKGEIYYE